MHRSGRDHDPQSSLVGAIAALHDRHDRRVAHAQQVRGARIAAVDAKTASRLAPLIARCGASVVPLFAEPQIVVVADQGLFEDRHALGGLRAAVVQESELAEMVEAFDEVYRPPSLEIALRRARTRAERDGSASRIGEELRARGAGDPREAGSGRGLHSRSRPGERSYERPAERDASSGPYVPQTLSDDERALQDAARRSHAA